MQFFLKKNCIEEFYTEFLPCHSVITLGARDFSSAVSSFCQVLIVARAARFFSRLRPTAEDMSTFD